MSVRKDLELLKQVPTFSGTDPGHLQILLFSAKTMRAKAGDVIVKQGEKGDSAYLILEGQAEILITEDGQEDVVAHAEQGAFIGELSMIARLPYRATARATSPLQAMKIPHALFLRVVKEFPEFGARVLRGLAGKLDGNIEQLRQVRDQFDRGETFP